MAIVVKAGPKDSTDSVIRKFQKKIVAEGFLQEIRKREFYKKPSQLKQEYMAERQKKLMRYRRTGG